MDIQTFERFRDLIYRESGISLTEHKIPLLSSRIAKRLRARQLSSPDEYLKLLELDPHGEELTELLDVISTNVTHFFREEQHFAYLATYLKDLTARGKKEIKIWCAAASSGEEPYSIAITLAENVDLTKVNFKMLATDICTSVLKQAIAGEYAENQFRQTNPQIKSRYFKPNFDNKLWRVSDKLKQLILYKRLNLSQFPYPLKGPMDIIFCRNVMIYFELELKQKIAQEAYRLLNPGGLYIIGCSENLLGIEHKFKSLGSSIYQK